VRKQGAKANLRFTYRVEAVDAEVHAAEGDGVEREASEVVGRVDAIFGAEAFPLQDELGGDVEHVVEHGFDVSGAEGGHQEAVYEHSSVIRTHAHAQEERENWRTDAQWPSWVRPRRR
jgi:hypothetical protein